MLQVLKSSKGLQNNCYIRYSNALKYNTDLLSGCWVYCYTIDNNTNKSILNKLSCQIIHK